MTITNSSTRLVAIAAGVAVALGLMGAVAIAPAQAAGLNQTQISSIVSLLASFGADSATIANVTAALNGQATPGTGTGTGTGGACPALSRSLQLGSSGADVKALQVFLNAKASTQVSISGAGSPGFETTYFGPATKAAVVKFQTLNNVSAIGVVGPATRAAIAAVCGGVVTPNPTPGTGGSLVVAAGAQPVNSLAPSGAARVPFTTFTLTNNSSAAVTVNSVTVQRVGFGIDANLSGIVLLDQNGLQIGISKTLNSNHQANIGDTFTLGAGQSMTFTVAGNIADSSTAQTGQVVALQVVSVNTAGAAVSGSLPISGASQTINTNLTLGGFSTSTSSFDPGTQTKNIGDSGVRFAGIRFTATSQEDLKFYSIRWRQVGSASASDLSNVTTVVNGTGYAATVDSTGKYYTTVFPGGIIIPKGQQIEAYIKGDIVGSNAAGRTADFDIDRATDVYFVGQVYGYGVVDTVYPTAQPWYNGKVTTIQAGTATAISRASEVGSQNISINVSNQPLGAFATDFAGEAVSAQTMTVSIATSTGKIPDLITDMTVVDSNGSVVAGPVDATWVSAAHTAQTVTFSNTVTFPTGRKVWAIRGKIPTTAVDGTSVQLTVTPSNWTNVTGQTSGSNISLSSYGGFTLSSMTIKGATFTVSMSSQPGSQNVVANAQTFTFANVLLDASQSGEDIRVNSIPVRVSNNTGLSGCVLKDSTGATISSGSNVPTTLSTSAANTFYLNSQLTVTKGSIKTLSMVCNLSSGSGSYAFSLNSGDTITVTGQPSGNSFSATNSANSGGTMSVGSPSSAVTVAASSPAVTLASAGTTGVVVGKVNVRATNETQTLTALGLKLTTGTPASIQALWLVDDVAGTVTAVPVPLANGSTATTSLSIPLPVDTDRVLTIKADLAPVTSQNSGSTEGALIQIDPMSAETNSPSSGLLRTNATGSVAGVRVYKTFPTVAQLTPTGSNVQSGRLIRFSVKADAANSLSLGKFTFTISTTTATIKDIGLYAFDANGNLIGQSGAVVNGLIDELLATSTMANCTTSGGSTCSNNGTLTTLTIRPATNPITVPAGTTYTFELRASTITSATTGASVTTRLKADTSASPSTGTGTYASLSASNFIWSPNGTTTPSLSAGVDWTNGYSIPGFQSDLIQGLTQ